MRDKSLEETQERIYAAKKEWHKQQARLPVEEKMRILIEIQKHDVPLIAAKRPLQWFEKPWDIEP